MKIRILFVCLTLLLSAGTLRADAGAYYAAIDTSSPSFVADLHRLINPHTVISYDAYKTTIIPAYETQTAPDGRTYVTCVYSGEQYFFTPPFAWGYFSREHTFCHSWMPSYPSTSGPEYSDQHHLFPTNQNDANARRSNHPLGVVVSPSFVYLDGKLGTDAMGRTVYEPRNAQKGDAARALMYMMVCYNGVNGNDWTLGHLNTVTLPALSEGPEDESLLKAWSAGDPPDQWEIGRNDYIASVQHNRNPFVDHPEYAAKINFTTLTRAVAADTGSGTPAPTDTTSSSVGPFTALYTFTGAGDTVNAQPPFGTFSPMTRAGVVYNTGTDYFNSNSWATTGARDDAKYVAFTLSLAPGASLANVVMTLSFDNMRSSSGPASGEVRYRFGAGAFQSAGTWTVPTSWTMQTMTIAASGSAASAFEVRFFGWNATGTSGTMRFDNVKLVMQDAALPVELTAFSAQRRGAAVHLAWSSASERNNYGFAVERSRIPDAGAAHGGSAARAWTQIGFIGGHGTTNASHAYAFTDTPGAGPFAYRLKQMDRDGAFAYSPEAIAGAEAFPALCELGQNYPNPFNPSTTIDYRMAGRGHVVLSVFDVLGREVARLADGDKEAGLYSAEWNASGMPGGVYFYRLNAGTSMSAKKMMLQK